MKIASNDDFEHRYTQEFRNFAASFGIFVTYERDRGTRDIGLHFTQYKKTGDKIVTPVLAWFQLKGIRTSRLSAQKFAKDKKVTLQLLTNHMQFWYVAPQPTYLVIYIESAQEFLVANIQKIIGDTLGAEILHTDQASHSVRVDSSNKLDEHAINLILGKNLVPVLRAQMSREEEKAHLFLRDSSFVLSLFDARRKRKKCRARIIKYMSKMRTEVYFEVRSGTSWRLLHSHWEYLLDSFKESFPYVELRLPDSEDHDADWNEDEYYGDETLKLPNGQVSFARYSEMMEHVLDVKLNELGVAWGKTLETLAVANILAIDRGPTFVSVAPFHRRDL